MTKIGISPRSIESRLTRPTIIMPPSAPATTPSPIWRTKSPRIASEIASAPLPAAISSTSATVRKIAIGSFDPDSISSVERTLSRMVMPPMRSRKNTAAASVEPTIAPSRKPSSQDSPST